MAEIGTRARSVGSSSRRPSADRDVVEDKSPMRRISTLAWVGISLFGTCFQDLSFGPEPGVHLVKTFESSLQLDLEELTLQYDDLKPNSHLWCEITVAEKRRSVWIDEYAA